MIKKIVLSIIGIITLLVVILALFFINPFVDVYEKRISDKTESIGVVYMNVTGSDNCAKLYIEQGSTKKAIYPAYPSTIPAIEETKLAYANNVFQLKGYTYELIRKNWLTQQSQVYKSSRFDVVGWKVKVPYTVWLESENDDEIVQTEKLSKPVEYSVDSNIEANVLSRKIILIV